MYKIYCSSFDASSELLAQKLRERQDLAKMLDNADNRVKNRLQSPFNIFSFLIMPVQRIPRYILLFEQLLNATESTHPDFDDISLAVEKAREIASHINENVTKEEHRQKIIEIEKRFVLSKIYKHIGLSRSLVQPHRRYITEGPMLLENTMTTVKYYCYLFNDVFVTTRVLSTSTSLKLYQDLESIVPLKCSWIVEDTVDDHKFLCRTADKCCFALLTPEVNFVLRCKDIEERKKWTTSIGEAISNYMELKSSHQSIRSVSFPKYNNGKWRFGPLQDTSLALQMAKHIYIRGMPPSCLIQPQKQRTKSMLESMSNLLL